MSRKPSAPKQIMNGIIYEGPSLLDGAPIVVIATLRKGKDANVKTGNMVQTWIIRTDVSPIDAVKSGADSSICGKCPHRGNVLKDGTPLSTLKPGETPRKRSCYVNLGQAPRSVYGAYRRGRYERVDAAEMGRGRTVRLGSYGDPAAVPFEVLAALTSQCTGHTGYTHQWKTCAPVYSKLLMASADSMQDRVAAGARGWRTFRVRAPEQAVAKGEVVCPASKEAQFKTTCMLCKACGGTSSKAKAGIVIIAHGATANNAMALARAA